ncbi:nucleoside-diphosphate sugar epimerase/dehydratase [Methanobrevibacter sp.]|uniref:polysaccharide biosynthesis protein n=1 Tax=Methanobrevibacter sp. TaxID=66852 RepID=UPI0026DEDFA2|nr:nucleoside-diphosphate sugar epimerase/dehydratase [Methanobrevibacter sp.]MDO5823561.1 nucleoside-diphosphate sugar epimerase/dehydratase [Methanobrevibacter sp.]
MKMDNLGKYRNFLLPLMDCVSVILGYYLISVLITDSFLMNPIMIITRNEILISIILAIIVLQIIFRLTKRYSNIVRYENNQDYILYILFSVTSLIIVSLIEEAFLKMKTPSIKFNLSVGILIGIIIVAYHLVIRYVLLSYTANKGIHYGEENREKLLIIGGGYSANDIIKTLNSTLKGRYEIIGIIDDNRKRIGYTVAGVRIIGSRKDIVRICDKYQVDSIFFTIVNIDNKNKKEILEICSKTDAEVKVLPGLRELISSENLYNSLRDVEIEDLLGRDPVELDNNNIKSLINDKVVLVTGGGGSIGEELCRQIMLNNPKQLLMLDIYENNLYNIELELKDKYPNNDIKAIIANIRDEKRIFEIFEEYSPEIVFHAAAHKHVPLMENNPTEAIKNNVFGTNNLVNACDKYHTKRFILISTDKAVNPTNIMGATKRLCEMIIQAKDKESETEFVAVRFGNVLGSNGSVVPLFKKQIDAGGPVTVTHKDITRFFMTIPEAIALVLQSITYAKGGEIFVLNMGDPVKIYDLAKSLIELSGLTLGEDIEIKITGLRPGEKLYEEILMDEENLEETGHEKIFITEPMDFTMDDVNEKLTILRNLIEQDITDKTLIKESMKKCVPTYRESSDVNGE